MPKNVFMDREEHSRAGGIGQLWIFPKGARLADAWTNADASERRPYLGRAGFCAAQPGGRVGDPARLCSPHVALVALGGLEGLDVGDGVGGEFAAAAAGAGDDAAGGLTTWERYEDVVRLSQVVVVDRPGAPVALSKDIAWVRVEVPRLEVSSTDLRSRFTDGRPLDYLVTQPVLDVISQRNLYGASLKVNS